MVFDATTWRSVILEQLVPEADASYTISNLVPTRGTVLGVRVPVIRKLATSFREKHAMAVQDVIALMDHLSSEGTREEVLFGIFLLAAHQKTLTQAIWPHLESWIDACDNWEICDQLAILIGGLVAKDLSLVARLRPWLRSDHIWRRRFPVAISTELNHRGRSHPKETFLLIEPVLDDPATMVRKAVAWALREVSKAAPNETIAFLEAHGHRLPRTVLRDGLRKLPDHEQARLLARFS